MSDTPWPNFSRAELQCKCSCGKMEMDPAYMHIVQKVRDDCGFPFPITSAYRCEAHDRRVSSSSNAGHGPHTTGKALDINLHGDQLLIFLHWARVHGLIYLPDGDTDSIKGWGGIGLKQRGPSRGRFIHIDNLRPEEYSPRPRLWTY